MGPHDSNLQNLQLGIACFAPFIPSHLPTIRISVIIFSRRPAIKRSQTRYSEEVKSFTVLINHRDYKSVLQPIGDRKEL